MIKSKRALPLLILILIGLLVLFLPIFGSYTGREQIVAELLESPSSKHWFGTDSLGRDLFARVFWGGRVSLIVGVVCSLISLGIGVLYGMVAGWSEGLIDRILLRVCDIFSALPQFILVSSLCLFFQMLIPFEDHFTRSFFSLVLGISLTHWINVARLTRNLVLEIKRRPFIEAAVAIGGHPISILWRHVLPNIAGKLTVVLAMQVPTSIMYESYMSFIGLGIQPPYTSWGNLVREGWTTLSSYPHLILCPSLVVFLTVWSIHLLMDDFSETKDQLSSN